MKQLTTGVTFKSMITLFMLCFIQTVLWAQDNSGSTTTSTSTTHITSSGGGDSNWYTAPWVWIVGAAIFILLLVALTSGSRKSNSSNSERVTVTKTVSRDNGSDAV